MAVIQRVSIVSAGVQKVMTAEDILRNAHGLVRLMCVFCLVVEYG